MKHIKLILVIFFFQYTIIGLKGQIQFTELSPDTTLAQPRTANSTIYYRIDINGDTITDYKIGIEFKQTYESVHEPLDNYTVFIISFDNRWVNVGPYFLGDTINQTSTFKKSNFIYGKDAIMGFLGPWPKKNEDTDNFAYLGIKMDINGNNHYGWIKIKTNGHSFTLDSYAYNITPNQYIKAGQTN